MRLNPLLLFIVAFHSLISSDKLKCSPVFTVQPESLSYGEPTRLAKKNLQCPTGRSEVVLFEWKSLKRCTFVR